MRTARTPGWASTARTTAGGLKRRFGLEFGEFERHGHPDVDGFSVFHRRLELHAGDGHQSRDHKIGRRLAQDLGVVGEAVGADHKLHPHGHVLIAALFGSRIHRLDPFGGFGSLPEIFGLDDLGVELGKDFALEQAIQLIRRRRLELKRQGDPHLDRLTVLGSGVKGPRFQCCQRCRGKRRVIGRFDHGIPSAAVEADGELNRNRADFALFGQRGRVDRHRTTDRTRRSPGGPGSQRAAQEQRRDHATELKEPKTTTSRGRGMHLGKERFALHRLLAEAQIHRQHTSSDPSSCLTVGSKVIKPSTFCGRFIPPNNNSVPSTPPKHAT